MASVIALVTVFVPMSARAEVSDYWAEKDVDARLEPHYESISYTLDPIEVVQRFDAQGDWYWPATTEMDDSKLTLTAATNASLNVAHDANLDDGKYYEIRVKATAASNFTFKLEDDGTDYLSMMLAANQGIFAKYTSSTSTTTSASLATWAAATWVHLGIDCTAADTVFYVYYDGNGTVDGYATAANQNLTYSEIHEVEFSQSVAAKTATVDWFVQTSAHTDLTPIGQASRALRVTSEETVTKRNVAYTLDELKDVVTLSNDSAVQDVIGYTSTGKDLSNDNKLNDTDLGHILMETPEDIDAKFRGTTVVKGWDSMKDSIDESIENYLAERHDVAKAYVIDYYIDDMKFNITVTEGMAEKVEKATIKTFMDQAEDEGAEITYDDQVGIRSDYTDFDYAYMPRDITGQEWEDMKQDLSNAVRKKCFSMVALTQARPAEVVDPLFEFYIMASMMGVDLTGDLDVDTTYQETNALIGSILLGEDYTAVDAETLDSEMATSSASGFDTVEDGKASTSGLSLITCYSSILIYVLVVVVVIASAFVIVLMLAKRKKHKRAKKH